MRRAHQLALIDNELKRVREEAEGWEFDTYEFPYLIVRIRELGQKEYRIRLDLREYDLQPPAVDVLTFFGKLRAPRAMWPKLSKFTHETTLPETGDSWVCTEGVRAYHDHFVHLHNSWDQHRNWKDLHAILTNLARNMQTPRPPHWRHVS